MEESWLDVVDAAPQSTSDLRWPGVFLSQQWEPLGAPEQ
jgi:hypothetical protein